MSYRYTQENLFVVRRRVPLNHFEACRLSTIVTQKTFKKLQPERKSMWQRLKTEIKSECVLRRQLTFHLHFFISTNLLFIFLLTCLCELQNDIPGRQIDFN